MILWKRDKMQEKKKAKKQCISYNSHFSLNILLLTTTGKVNENKIKDEY